MVTYILCGIGVLVVLYVVMAFNRLSTRRNQIQNAISSLDSLFIQRAELIPNLIETTKQYMQYSRKHSLRLQNCAPLLLQRNKIPIYNPNRAKRY